MSEALPSILFVDDEERFLDSIRRLLHKYDKEWQMNFVLSAVEAVEFIGKESCDVLVTDINMPGKSGFDLIRILKADAKTRDIPVVVVTGSGEAHLKRQALELGAADLMNKPADTAELVARIRNTLVLKSYQDQIRNQNKILEQRVRDRTAELEAAHLDIIWRLAKAGERRDYDTGSHVVRVAKYCAVLAKGINLPGEQVDLISITSPLHDIGKIGIPDRILLKPKELSTAEKEYMRRHCEIGADILTNHPGALTPALDEDELVFFYQGAQSNPFLKMAASIALTHHEWWDGSGYPQGIGGEAIPLESRILMIADVYDALRSPRPYKGAYSLEQTLAIMNREKKAHFDPYIFSIFESNQDRFNEIWAMFGGEDEPGSE